MPPRLPPTTAAHWRDAEAVCQACLAMHPVFHRDHREVRAVDPAGRRIDAGGAAGTVATAEVVEGDDEELAGVDRLARTDAAVPPAGLRSSTLW